MRYFACALVVVLLVAASTEARGDTILVNAPPSTSGGYGVNRYGRGTDFDCVGGNFNHVTWWGFAPTWFTGSLDGFVVRVWTGTSTHDSSGWHLNSPPTYTFSVGAPTSEVAGTRPDGDVFYKFDADVPLTYLGSGTHWITIANDVEPSSPTYPWTFAWVASSVGGSLPGGVWEVLAGQSGLIYPNTTATHPGFAFQLSLRDSSPVPEPTTFALLGLGIVGLAWRRRHR